MTIQSTALVPFVEPEFDPSTLTPFAVFYKHTVNRSDAITPFTGNATWMRFPTEKAIALGLALTLQKMASSRGIKLHTETAIEKMAKRMNSLLNGGLYISFHGDMSLAVTAFMTEIIGHENSQKPTGVTNPVTAYGLSTAKFFIRMIKACKDRVAEIESSIELIRERNNLGIMNLIDEEHVELVHFDQLVNFFGLKEDHGLHEIRMLRLIKRCKELDEAIDKLIQIEEYMDAVEKLPFDLKKVPSGLGGPALQISVDGNWVRSQLLIARTRNKERHTTTLEIYHSGQAWIQDIKTNTLVRRVWAHWRAMGMQVSGKDAKVLRSMLRSHAIRAKAWPAKMSGPYSGYYLHEDPFDVDSDEDNEGVLDVF